MTQNEIDRIAERVLDKMVQRGMMKDAPRSSSGSCGYSSWPTFGFQHVTPLGALSCYCGEIKHDRPARPPDLSSVD